MDELIQCKTCKYYDPANMLVRCVLCRPEMKYYEPKGETMKRYCYNCKHYEKPPNEYPCNMCDAQWARWEPIAKTKEENMENENATTKIDTEAKLKELEEKVEEQERLIRELERMNTQKDGEIRGLKFALRCNGISGGEV